MRLYIIRHADPDYPNKTITAHGHKEAEALSHRMAREQITKVYASPLGRAQHTAQYTADRLGLPIHTEPWTKELGDLRMSTGVYPNKMIWDLHGEVLRHDPDFAKSGDWSSLPPLDEPIFREQCDAVAENSDAFLARHGYERVNGTYRITAPNRERIAIFCHGGFGLTWLAHLLEIPLPLMWSGFWLSPSSVSVVLMDERSTEWAVPRALCLADTSHIYEAGYGVTPHGIQANFD